MEGRGKEVATNAMEPANATFVAKERAPLPKESAAIPKTPVSIAKGLDINSDKTKKARVMRNVTPGKHLPRVINGEFISKIFKPSRRVDLPGQDASSSANAAVNVPNSSSPFTAPDMSATANTSSSSHIMESNRRVMCCAEMVHKNKGMDMDKRQEFMHKLIFDRRGKLADHTIDATNSEVPWRDYKIILGVATEHQGGHRSSRLFAYRSETKLRVEQFVEITGTRPPMASWVDREMLEKECLIRASGTNVIYTCPFHAKATHYLYHVTHWRGNQVELA